jgi:flagella basal body P-ring formation protein FlgA
MKNYFNIWSQVLLAGLFAISARSEDTGEWRLLAEAQVDSQGIFLDQIIAPNPASAAIPHTRLSGAPNQGQAISLSRKQITELVQMRGAELITTNWSGTTQVRVTRRTRQFSDFELLEMLTTNLQRDFAKNRGELELRFSRPFPRTIVPDEPLTLKVVEMPPSGLTTAFLAKCELWTANNERVSEWQVNLLASIWHDIPVARSPVPRGTLLKDADFSEERRDVLARHDYYLNYPTTDETLEVTGQLQPGMPLLAHGVRSRPIIQRGRVVDGVYKDGTLSISLKVETMEDGTLGQVVRVINPKTRREFYGKVQNEETVLISL